MLARFLPFIGQLYSAERSKQGGFGESGVMIVGDAAFRRRLYIRRAFPHHFSFFIGQIDKVSRLDKLLLVACLIGLRDFPLLPFSISLSQFQFRLPVFGPKVLFYFICSYLRIHSLVVCFVVPLAPV